MKTSLVLAVALALGALAGCDRGSQPPATPKAAPASPSPAPAMPADKKADPAVPKK